MIAKAGLGLIGLSAISVGGVALAKPHLLGMDYMPEWHSLSEDNNFANAHSDTTKFGNKYGKYLVGVTHKKKTGGETEKDNKSWWEWAFRRWKGENPNTGKFKYVKPENGNGADALKKLCEEAYKKGDSEFHSGTGANTDNKPTKDEVWKYCSPGKLTTISEDTETYTSGQIGEESANKTALISVKNSANDWFWKIRDEEFWGSDTSSNLSGSKATNGDQSKQSSFKAEYEKNKDSGKVTSRQTIKKLCEEAYKLTKSENDKDNTDANRFCKLETN